MTTYHFTLIVEGADLQSAANVDALFEAGCDDALVGRVDDVQFVEFDRESATLEAAVLSAVTEVERISGAHVVRLADAGLVSMADIAERASRTRESVRLLVAGERGPGAFPPPVTDPRGRYRLWRWSEVRRWFADDLGELIEESDGHVVEAINAGLEFRHHVRYVSAECRSEVRELAGL
jgi:hypothetical protein